MDKVIINEKITSDLSNLKSFVDYEMMNKIVNKLTDYAEILTEGRLSATVNYGFNLNSGQTNMIIDFLLEIQAISKIFMIAQKGKKDLEEEFFSNIFSDIYNPHNVPAYMSIRNMIENRLNDQIQHYNINMSKSNTTLAMPISELAGHVTTMRELSQSDVVLSHKAQHGYIAASLHDAYARIINRSDWWDDKTYMKYFFNERNNEKQKFELITQAQRFSLGEIGENIKSVLAYFQELEQSRFSLREEVEGTVEYESGVESLGPGFMDRLMASPFGKRYGERIDRIIDEIFNKELSQEEIAQEEAILSQRVDSLYQVYKTLPGSLKSEQCLRDIMPLGDFLITESNSLKKFMENYMPLILNKSLYKSQSKRREEVRSFLIYILMVYFEKSFEPVFKIVRSLDMKQYACAFIVKRIQLKQGEGLSEFGSLFLTAIAKYGKVRIM